MERVWHELKARAGIVPPIVITIAGTNGKGSSCALFDAILQAAAYRVGRYTSPHLFRFNERIQINGVPATDELLMAGMQAVHACEGSERLTYFEWATLLAFWVFSRMQCQVWVLEVGMGGRLDAVNVLDADLALITNIGLDHQAFLGRTRDAIGFEKAGILRRNQIAVYADPAPVDTVLQHAESIGCPLQVVQRDYSFAIIGGGRWRLSLAKQASEWPEPALFGARQIDNAAGVVALVLLGQSRLPVPADAIAQGLRRVQLPGRFEQLDCKGRRLIFDVAHNEESTRTLLDNLAALAALAPPAGKIRAVFSALADKPLLAMIELCAKRFDAWYLAPLAGDRAATLTQLQHATSVLQTNDIHYEPNIVSAYNRAFDESIAGDWLVVFGSFHTIGALRSLACEPR